MPAAVIRLTASENSVWRTVSFDAGVDRLLALAAEAAQLVLLPAEGDDDPQHRHRLVDDREDLALQVPGLDQARLDAAGVVDRRVVDERHDGQ